jgi:MFS transporter, DHA2 family, multidrug resistance protein
MLFMDRAYPPRDTPRQPHRWLVLAITAAGLLLICVDLTVLYIALPALSRGLHASSSAMLWILNAYPLAVAGLLPGLGTLGDRYGHRRMYLVGLATFGIASLAAAFAPTAAALIGARAILGVGAAMMMPATLAIIRSTFADAEERAVAIGIWSGVASAGMALGPFVAGVLLEHYWWGAVFLINVPLVLVAGVLTLLFVPKESPPGGPAWDALGSLQILVGLTALVYAIQELAHRPFSVVQFIGAVIISAIAITWFLRRQRQQPVPMIDFTLFRLPNFSGAFAAACLGTAGAVGMHLSISQYLQLSEQLAPLATALVMLPVAIAGFIAGPLAGRVMHRIGAANLGSISLWLAAASAAALGLFAIGPHVGNLTRMVLLAGIGFGLGASVTFASTVIMNAAPPERGGMAASIEEVSYELGGALGIAIFGSLFTVMYSVAANAVDGYAVATRAVLYGVAALWALTAMMVRSQQSTRRC